MQATHGRFIQTLPVVDDVLEQIINYLQEDEMERYISSFILS
jgi:hypothetical protein